MMTTVFSSINGQKEARLPAVIRAVIFMLILILSWSWPGFIQAQAEEAPPDEQKVVEWLEELAAATEGEAGNRLEIWLGKSYLGLEAGPDQLMALYERGNILAGIFFEQYAKRDTPPYNGPGEAEKWAGINKSNQIVTLLAPLAKTNIEAMKLMSAIAGNGLGGHPYGGWQDAEKWSEKVAEAGDSDMQHAFVQLALMGGDERPMKSTGYWLRRIAESGNEFDCAKIGRAYATSYFMNSLRLKYEVKRSWLSGVESISNLTNLAEAVRWLRRGAESGEVDCQTGLASLYEQYGGFLGCDEAKKWYEKAAENGDQDSRFWLNLNYSHGEQGPSDDHSKNLAHYRELAEAGDPDGQFMLGVMYAGFHENYPENQPEAVKWLEKAYEAGETNAASSLAYLYSTKVYPYGDGVNMKEAVPIAEKWLTIAAENGDGWALERLRDVREQAKKSSFN